MSIRLRDRDMLIPSIIRHGGADAFNELGIKYLGYPGLWITHGNEIVKLNKLMEGK